MMLYQMRKRNCDDDDDADLCIDEQMHYYSSSPYSPLSDIADHRSLALAHQDISYHKIALIIFHKETVTGINRR